MAAQAPSSHDMSPPRPALLAGAGLIVAAIAFGALGHWADIGTVRIGEAEEIEAVSLIFANRPDGGTTVTRAEDGRLMRRLAPGQDGFVWGAINGLSRGRRQAGLAEDAPYRLVRRSDGLLVLSDPTTGQMIVLRGFGRDNTAVFAALLADGLKRKGDETP